MGAASLLAAFGIALLFPSLTYAESDADTLEPGERPQLTEGPLEPGEQPQVMEVPLELVDPDAPMLEMRAEGALRILDHYVGPGESQQLELVLSESFAGMDVKAPVRIVRGDPGGPTVCLVAGIHGDEIVGIEAVRRVVDRLDPATLRGTVIAMPIANPMGFRRSSRYLPDRRDLNRYFPGRRTGSLASRIANRIFEEVIRNCQVLIDFHSGSFHRANMPQARADLQRPELLGMATWFGAPAVVHSAGQPGTLRRAAGDAGIQALLYEAGEPMRFDESSVKGGVRGTLMVLQALGMIDPELPPGDPSEVFAGSHWIRAEEGGIFLSDVQIGDWVKAEMRLGTIVDPFTNDVGVILASRKGRILGRALDQVVIPGYALYHVGTVAAAAEPPSPTEPPADGSDAELDERPE